jgi:hypothetical protein
MIKNYINERINYLKETGLYFWRFHINKNVYALDVELKGI